MKRKLIYIFSCWLSSIILFVACDDMEDKPFTSGIIGDPTETGTAELYVLCEGLFNQNNSSLARFSFGNQQMVRDYFKAVNRRGLGDTANDMAIYGSKIYVIVNISSTVEVIDFRTGSSLKQIQMLAENGSSRQPRYIAFHKEKAYVCSYDGTVARIDTTSLSIEAITSVGRNPDGICVQNEKLYISNSGGLDYSSGLGVDNTVSVVDIATFKESSKLTVGPNPGKIVAGPDETVYVATRGEDVEAGDYNFVKIDCRTNKVTQSNEKVQNFAIDGEIAYLYNYNYNTQTSSIKMFNLKTEDIVNMGMAKMAKAPVLLVGDIDRGGVFAQLIGTVELLEEDEREMVKGLIINKFRGDKTILDPGVQMLEERSHIPVVGVAPYLDIQVEDEDSLTERFDRKQEVDLIDIAVIRVPRISNFTDFNPLESIPGVSLRYVQHVSELKNPDMIILPGTKNTMEDLLWMRANGLEAAVLKEAAKGKIIFGICGGYQMLGEILSDPHHVEAGGTIKGMGLLPMDTVFAEKKTRTRVSGRFLELEGELQALSGAELEGYEIHMGETVLKGEAGHSVSIEDQVSGECKKDGAYCKNVCGTYVHGVFDREDVAEAVVRVLGEKKGIDVSQMTGIDFAAFKETQYDILAAELRKHLDMKKIYEILEQGI